MMTVNPPTGGARLFREDQKRRRRLLRAGVIVAWVFGVFMTQVWLSTEVKERQARVSQLDVTIGRLEVDLSALEGRMQKEQTFAELLDATESLGLSSDGVRQRVALPAREIAPVPAEIVEPAQAGMMPNLRALQRSHSARGHGKGH